MKRLIPKIAEKIKKDTLFLQAYEDMYGILSNVLEQDRAFGIAWTKWLSERIWQIMPVVTRDNLVLAQKFMSLHKRVLHSIAQDDFDSFLLFVEWEREPAKQFYLPRRKTLKMVVDSLQALADDQLDLLAISLPPGAGKLLADDTPVMTKFGWKKHGDLCVGDYVVGLDGKYKRVEHIFPKGVANYEVEFTNGEKIKCHGKHEWVVYNRHRLKYETLETEEMLKQGIETGTPNKRGHRYMFVLPAANAVEGAKTELPVDPYVLGAWLGDGTASKPAITICDTDTAIVEKIKKAGYALDKTYPQAGCKRYEFYSLRDKLRELGLCVGKKSREKFIPEAYMTASVEDRLELLAGLIDTDGTKNRENRLSFSTTNERLKCDVRQLISTFGWRCSVTTCEAKTSTSGIKGTKSVHVINFCPDIEVPCVLDRKKLKSYAMRRRISVSAIRPIEPVCGNCIQVEDGIYRVGHTMLPTHNSTLAIFFLTWLAGKIPDKPILTGSHSNAFVRGVYDECLRIFDKNGEYLWRDVFPYVGVSNTNAKDCRIDLGERKRFETLEFTSIGSGNAGLYRAATLLYCDDLVSGIEVALSKERLDKLWETYTTDLRQRKIGDKVKELHIATRWSVHDVIGRLEEEYGNSDRAKFIVVPAMDENDESNFDYAYGVGFSTKFYREQRNIMDPASWKALYMNQPIEREGLLYDADELRRYFELPEGEPDAVIGVCDTKDRGSDYCVLPVAYVYGRDYYIADCICDNGLPDTVDARLTEILLLHKVKQCRFESNSAGGRIAQKIQEEVKKRHGITHITTKYTTANKETKIIVNSQFVKEHCLFKDDSMYKRNTDYGKFMDMLCSYTLAGKNKHDDVCDAMAMLAEYAQSMNAAKVEVFQRPW